MSRPGYLCRGALRANDMPCSQINCRLVQKMHLTLRPGQRRTQKLELRHDGMRSHAAVQSASAILRAAAVRSPWAEQWGDPTQLKNNRAIFRYKLCQQSRLPS